ncbi:MAG: 2Fe-2S iron-sulfur cluster-binding protein, partial [Syntrophales bacterium]
MKKAIFVLNGKETPYRPGQTLLEATQAIGFHIPTLCHLKETTPTGACRICLVEIAGARSLMAACSTPVAEGMEVFTETERVHNTR